MVRLMRVRKLILPVLAAVTLLVIALGLSGWWLVKSDPAWYKPVVVDPAMQAQRQKELQNQITELRNQVGKAHVASATQKSFPAFDVEFTEDQLNGTVSRWQDFPALAQAMSKLSEPHIRFLDDRIELAGRINADGPLVSIALTVHQTPQGPKVELGRPYAGRMPLTRTPLEEASEEVDAKLQGVNVPKPTTEFVKELLSGETLTPVVAVPSSVVGKQDLLPARVEKLTIKDGVLRATLRPFDPKDK